MAAPPIPPHILRTLPHLQSGPILHADRENQKLRGLQ